ncbi:MAG: NAD(P)H-dependent oxidoreductase [Candidatus Cloacimonetes bacterium]|nr:NAD(P)H-dependent oxidoreductase [Candidatus Cloacimonadota bacterium]
MKIIVLNGSPKGKESVTLHYVKFIQKNFPDHEYEFENISQQIKRIEKDEKVFNGIIEKVKSADAVIWAFPLYVFLVAAQYKRFIELISERNVQSVFQNKYTAVLSTSIHFYDHTAHNYMRAICEDLNMKYAEFISAGMSSLSNQEGQNELLLFAENFFNAIENDLPVIRYYSPLKYSNFQYKPEEIINKISTRGKKILLLTDSTDPEGNLAKMTAQFKANFSEEIEEYNIHDLDIKGGCLGCIHCGYDNTCIYEGKDEYNKFFDSKLKTADIIVYAAKIKDRFFSARWKMFIDRSFYNNHVPVFTGKQLVYLVSGPLKQIPNIRQIFEAWAQIQRGNLVDFVTDEYKDSAELDNIISATAQKTIRYADQKLKKEDNFLGVGGMKVFRDDIYGPLRFPFVADYKAFKKLGIFKSYNTKFKIKMVNFILYQLIKIPKIRKEIYNNQMSSQMVKPLKKLLEKI